MIPPPFHGRADSCKLPAMRTRRRILLLATVALLAVVFVLALVLTLSSSPPEPSYRGRKLSEWAQRSTSDSLESRAQAQIAIHQIGTNAIPNLLTWISYERPEWKTTWYPRLNPLLKRLNQNWVLRDKKDDRAENALFALSLLGPEAATAVNDLARLLNDPKAPCSADRAVRGLPALGEKAFPTLLAALTNSQARVRCGAVAGVQNLCERGVVSGTDTRLAVSGLIQCLKDKHKTVVRFALYALANVKRAPDLAVPALTDSLQDSRRYVPPAAALALGEFGNEARPAVPALLNSLTKTDAYLRVMASNALLKIAPEVFTNAPPATTPPPP